MENINNLIAAILEETKRQENKRKEYISLIHQLIESAHRIGYRIGDGEIEGKNIWIITFRYTKDFMGSEKIYFSNNIFQREDGKFDNLDKENKDIDECINTLYDMGEEYVDSFIAHLSNVAIPQFLQYRYVKEYYPKSYYIA